MVSENYYLQLALETGLLGLALFLAATFNLAVVLARSPEPIMSALLAAFIGLSLAGLFTHVWANDAVAYSWWGLAGLVYGRANQSYNLKHGN